MGKQAKPKTGQVNNDNRPNKKAFKQHPGRKSHGSKGGKLDMGTLILLGKGPYVRYAAMDAEGRRNMAKKRPKNDKKTED